MSLVICPLYEGGILAGTSEAHLVRIANRSIEAIASFESAEGRNHIRHGSQTTSIPETLVLWEIEPLLPRARVKYFFQTMQA